MEIKLKKDNTIITYINILDIGDTFSYINEVYMKIAPSENRNAINLRTGEDLKFYQEELKLIKLICCEV